MKKSEQIRALQAENDRLTKENEQLHTALDASDRARDLLRNRQPPSLVDQARSEFRAKWEWLLEAVGL